MKKILIIALVLISTNLLASPYNGEIHKFKQPDGTFIEVKLYGDEFYMRAESLDGYTVIRDEVTGWINYAYLSIDGSELLPTTIKYRSTQAIPVAAPVNFNSPQHLKIKPSSITKTANKNKQLSGFDVVETAMGNKTGVNPILGNFKGLTIIVDFSDAPGQLPLSEYEDLWNGNNYTAYGNNGSIKEYWNDVSNGLVVYENEVFGIFRPSNTFAYYDGLGYTQGAHQILQEALTWIDAQGFDFSTLSIKNGRIQAINLMYTGAPGAWAQGMWYHAGGYYGFSADGVSSGPYNCSSANSPLAIGTPCHENGHMLCGWPDLYKYNGTQSGIGNFCLMASGSQQNPETPNPHFTNQANWNTVVDVTNFNGVVHDIDWDDKIYKYEKNGDNTEFFLLKSARKTNRGGNFPDEGLTIWHIDTDGDNQTNFHEVYLKHANNNWNNQTGACFDLNADEFSNNSTPNANWHDGSPSNLYVWNVQSAGAIQDYNIGLVTTVPNTDFTTSALGSCNGIVSFTDLSNNSPSTAQHPTHTYLSSGTYTVILTSTNSIGSNTETKTNYVTVNVITAPTTTGTSVCVNSPATLTAAGSGVLNWYTSATGGPIINTGTSYAIPSASTTTTYYVADVNVAPNQNIGKLDNTGGGNDYNFQQHLFFDVYQAMEIISVEVYAGSVGNRTFELRDNGGNVLQTTTINLVLGQQTVNLNYIVTPGTNYQLGLSASTANISLFRNNAGVTYPYNLNGVASITGSSAATNPADYYYFFYNWVVKTADCESPRSSVTVNVLPTIDLTITNTSPTLTSNQSGATYQWLDCDNGNAIIPSATNQVYSATLNGNYAVEITVGSCIDTSACENINGLVTAVPNTEFSTNTLSSCNGIVSFTDLSNNSPTSW
jgi:M6 family metalloprotease-like protein